MEVHYEGTAVQDEAIQRVLAERGKTVYATAVRSGAILVDNGNLKLLGDVKYLADRAMEKRYEFCYERTN